MTLTIAQASKWLGPKRAEGGDRAPGVDPPARPVRARFRGRPRASPGRRRVSVTPQSQSAPFSEAASSECAFPSRRGAREVWGNPPPGCGALWRMPQLGKCARATPRQAAGRVARGFAGLGSESGLTERCTLPNRWAAECAFPSRRDRRMCFSVRCRLQSALFRRATLRLPR